MIKAIIFDFGGVIITLDQPQAIARFEALGLTNAAEQLDAYTQGGIFGELECGTISDEDFRSALSRQVGREVTWEECRHAWTGYCKEVPQRNLDELLRLRSQGYRLLLFSNTNPFMMSWAMSNDFDGHGHSVDYYMDYCYMSYKMGVMKPDERFFRQVLANEHLLPEEALFIDDGTRNVEVASQLGFHTLCPKNGEDWTGMLEQKLLNT